MGKRIISLFFYLNLFLISCSPKEDNELPKNNHLIKNRDYLRKIAFCRCLDLVDSNLKKDDFSSGIYFEKSAYDPEALIILNNFVKGAKPQFKSYADHKLGVGECLELYESDTLAKQITMLDSLLGNE
ncbi:MAG: hypothetical protein H7329_05270 [Opitutaceae bacterium]|nr:hypothetical protein [Cytophagales bacterium]